VVSYSSHHHHHHYVIGLIHDLYLCQVETVLVVAPRVHVGQRRVTSRSPIGVPNTHGTKPTVNASSNMNPAAINMQSTRTRAEAMMLVFGRSMT
jgi:hypothetical protein